MQILQEQEEEEKEEDFDRSTRAPSPSPSPSPLTASDAAEVTTATAFGVGGGGRDEGRVGREKCFLRRKNNYRARLLGRGRRKKIARVFFSIVPKVD